MTTLKIIEGQEKEWNIVRRSFEVYGPMGMGYKPDEIFNWHKQSIRQILESEIERKRGMKREIPYGITMREATRLKGYNSALEEDIAHLSNLLDSLK